MTREKIIKDLKITNGFISHLITGFRYTTRKNVAIAVANLTGEKPIKYIHPSRRKELLSDFPELDKKAV